MTLPAQLSWKDDRLFLTEGSTRTVTGSGGTTTLNEEDWFTVVDSSSNTETINLPSNPRNGQRHIIRREGGNGVTVSGGTNTLRYRGATGDQTIGSDGSRIMVVWLDADSEWKGAD